MNTGHSDCKLIHSRNSQAAPREEIKILYDYELKNAPGKSLVAFELHYGPGGTTPPVSVAIPPSPVLDSQFSAGSRSQPGRRDMSAPNTPYLTHLYLS